MKIKAIIEYNGANFFGFAKQINERSVQEEIEKNLSLILKEDIHINGSGRTDAGVHALNQVIDFDTSSDMDLKTIKYKMNSLLKDEIRFKSLEYVSDDFHARKSAKAKKYLYRFSIGDVSIFERPYVSIKRDNFDLNLFKEVIKHFIGEHNFQNFTSKKEDNKNYIRNIFDIKISEKENIVEVIFEGDGFMRYMVRDIIGASFAVCEGNLSLKSLLDHLDIDKRDILPYKAEAKGLFLLEVVY